VEVTAPIRLVLLPGMDGTGDLFEPLQEALDPHTRVDIVRYPGSEPRGYDELEPRVRAQLPADEPFVLLGESFSGPLAIAIAATPPPGLRGLILCCSFARAPAPGLALLRGGLLGLAMKFLHAAPLRGPMQRMLLGRDADPRLGAQLQAALGKVSTAVMTHRLRAVQRVNVTALLPRIRVPALYLQALQDRLVPAKAAAIIERALPALRIVRLDGPHGLLQASPAAAARVIDNFCRERALSAPATP
jgi:pimeloyl-ACP methyl ester carboxylesterase